MEDVNAYRDFALEQLGYSTEEPTEEGSTIPPELLLPFLNRLVNEVHPLALGNVHRVNRQIRQLGRRLLELNPVEGMDVDKVTSELATDFFSHLHMINRHEARKVLGKAKVAFVDGPLQDLLDTLLRNYEETFDLRTPFFLPEKIGDDPEKEFKVAGGVVESKAWGYLLQTTSKVRQSIKLPPNVQLQLQPGQPVPLLPGVPREYSVEVTYQKWRNNNEPRGIDV